MNHFYDAQIRRYVTQMVRLLSNFGYKDSQGNIVKIPVMYGDLTRQVANIIRDNSENKVPSAPRIAVYISGLEQDRDRTSDPSFVSKVQVRERLYDEENQEYFNYQGRNYTVERLMPAPYTLKLTADIWASNTDQKLQILEQLLVLFRPSFEIQTTDNYLDWTSLSVVNLEGVTFSSRTIPVGVDSEIDVAQLQFSTPIYLSPPAKVKRLGIIQNIITSLFDESTGNINLGLSGPDLLAWTDESTEFESLQKTVGSGGDEETVVDRGEFPNAGTGEMDVESEFRSKPVADNRITSHTSYQNYGLYILGGVAQIVDKNSIGEVNWRELFNVYPGFYRAGQSKLYLRTENTGNYIVGTITLDDNDETKVNINFDTDTTPDDDAIEGPARPSNAWTSIDYIIDPLRFDPNQDKSPGVRLLLLSDIGADDNTDGADGWKNADGSDFVAGENDIVEWDGSRWHIIFDSTETNTVTYISNLNTGFQYKWTGEYWVKSYEGEYSNGTWELDLQG